MRGRFAEKIQATRVANRRKAARAASPHIFEQPLQRMATARRRERHSDVAAVEEPPDAGSGSRPRAAARPSERHSVKHLIEITATFAARCVRISLSPAFSSSASSSPRCFAVRLQNRRRSTAAMPPTRRRCSR